jgi:hypothetical protein
MSTRNYYYTVIGGVIIGIVLSILSVIVKDLVQFHIKCDGTVVQTFSGDRYCIDPTILEGEK